MFKFLRNVQRSYNTIRRFQRAVESFAPKAPKQDGYYSTTGHPKVARRSWPAHLKQSMYKHQGGKCAGCRSRFPVRRMEIDHVIPLAAGGADAERNLQLLCKSCNREKGRHPMTNEELYRMAWGR